MRLPNPPQILMLPTAPQVCQATTDTSNQAGVHGAVPSFHQDWSMRKHPWHTFWSQWISKFLWKVFRWHFSQPLKTISASVGRVTDHNKPGAKLGTFTQTVHEGIRSGLGATRTPQQHAVPPYTLRGLAVAHLQPERWYQMPACTCPRWCISMTVLEKWHKHNWQIGRCGFTLPSNLCHCLWSKLWSTCE